MFKAEGVIAIPATAILPRIRDYAGRHGAAVSDDGAATLIRTQSAEIRLTPAEETIAVAIAAAEAQGLEGTVAVISELIQSIGQKDALSWTTRPRAPRRMSIARVEAMTAISPNFRRVRLSGDFSRFLDGGLHFRLLFSPPGAGHPTYDAAGEIDWPQGPDAWHRPPYTVRKLDPAGQWMDVDIFVHDGGRVTEWTEEVRPGDEVPLVGPGGRGVKKAGWIGLVGDETALPVILRALEGAGPDTRGVAYIQVPDVADAQDVVLPPGITLHWVTRDQGRDLLEIFRSLTPPEDDRYLMFAGERAQSLAATEHARAIGMGQGEYHCAAYWTAGWVPPAIQRQARGA